MDRRQLQALDRDSRQIRRELVKEEDMRRRRLQEDIERINRQREALMEQRMQTVTQPLSSFEQLYGSTERDYNMTARPSSSVKDEVEMTDINESVFLREDPLDSLQIEMSQLQQETDKEKEERMNRTNETGRFEAESKGQ